jgi:hypothetical protein
MQGPSPRWPLVVRVPGQEKEGNHSDRDDLSFRRHRFGIPRGSAGKRGSGPEPHAFSRPRQRIWVHRHFR